MCNKQTNGFTENQNIKSCSTIILYKFNIIWRNFKDVGRDLGSKGILLSLSYMCFG